MSARLMIVEDESIVAIELSDYLEDLSYEVVGIASSGVRGFKMAMELRPDVILMDVNIYGDEDGIDLAKRIKEELSCAIIYITAFTDTNSLERAIETDPASYLTKPFNHKELEVAIKIALKRAILQKDEKKGGIEIDDEFSYDPFSQQLLCRGEYVHLTKQERELLQLLIEANGQLISSIDVESRLWPDKFPSESTRRGVVSRLRSKLKYQFIETVSGQGYRFRF